MGNDSDMSRIYDENAIAVGTGFQFALGPRTLSINRTPTGEWNFDAGGTDVVTVSAAQDGGYFVSAGAAPAYRSTFASAAQLALRRLELV